MARKKDMSDVEVLLEGLDENNISSILTKWKEIVEVRKKLTELEDMLKIKVKIYLKEKKWNRYRDDDTGVSVSITTQKRESIDKEQLKIILTDNQYAQVVNIKSFEKMTIITPEMRKRLKNYVKKK